MTEEKNIEATPKTPAQLDINMAELIDLSAGILNNTLIKAPKPKAKALFKELKSGKQCPMGKITFHETLRVDYKLCLDYSEFVGPGFNFDVFQTALHDILRKIHEHLTAKKTIDFLNSEQSVVVSLPGLVQTSYQSVDHFNVLYMAFDFVSSKEFVLRLMFVDPEQFRRSDAPVDES